MFSKGFEAEFIMMGVPSVQMVLEVQKLDNIMKKQTQSEEVHSPGFGPSKLERRNKQRVKRKGAQTILLANQVETMHQVHIL